jgi:hypothetical protein
MTALQWIVKEAKSIKKKYPKRFSKWTEYVAQASAIYASKHKGKSPVGKKKAAPKKKAAKKRIGLSVVKKAADKVKRFARNAQDAFYEGYYEGKPIELSKKRAELKKKRVKSVKHKKISEQSILNKIHKVKDDVNKLDEAQHKHMLGRLTKIMGSVSGKYYINYTTDSGYKKMEFFNKLPKGYYKGMDRIIYVTRLTNHGTSLIPVKLSNNDKDVKK